MANNEGFKDKITKIFGIDDEYEDAYDDYDNGYAEEEPMDDQAPVSSAPRPQRTVSQGYGMSADVLVLDPVDFNEAPGIVNKLKEDKTIVVNLKQADFEEGRKIFDFLSGAVFALEGSLNRIAESVFILAPKQVSVSTQMDARNDASSYSAQILDWDGDDK